MNTKTCPKCNNINTVGAKFCKNCGYNFALETEKKITCPTCSKVFPEGSKFCDIDGTPLSAPSKTIRKCVVCATEYSSDVKFCPKDGGSITTISSTTSSSQTPPHGYSQQQNQSQGRNQYQQRSQQNLPPPNYGNSRNNPYNNDQYMKASAGNRFGAYLLDLLITIGLAIPSIIFLVAGFSEMDSYRGSEAAAGVYFILAALLYLIPLVYGFIKDGIGDGQSWGKKAVGLMVIHLPTNKPCDYGQSFTRNIVMTLLGFIPYVGWLIEPIMVLAAEDGRRLGDKAANTQVIEVRDYKN
ncbi:RDD family protein [Kordia algicida OT-1]|uniref:RDD domain-containing protein n=1 Tax=Kordia algicida OT-1 TaxID=391587 RepID=A9DJ11_9FLAO|nr:RDD family protein [Kordia algicida]EDP98005.1 hypothetical protein KAOT1_12347 [Kordia algicida OT-1]